MRDGENLRVRTGAPHVGVVAHGQAPALLGRGHHRGGAGMEGHHVHAFVEQSHRRVALFGRIEPDVQPHHLDGGLRIDRAHAEREGVDALQHLGNREAGHEARDVRARHAARRDAREVPALVIARVGGGDVGRGLVAGDGFEFHIGEVARHAQRGLHVAEAGREDDLVAGGSEVADHALGVRALGHVLDIGRAHLRPQGRLDGAAPFVVLARPAGLGDGRYVHEAGLHGSGAGRCGGFGGRLRPGGGRQEKTGGRERGSEVFVHGGPLHGPGTGKRKRLPGQQPFVHLCGRQGRDFIRGPPAGDPAGPFGSDRRHHAAPGEMPFRIRHEAVHAGLHGLGRPAGHVGREHDVVEPDEGLGRMRLALVHVQARAGDAARAQCVGQRLGIDHAAARDVHEVAQRADGVEDLGIHRVARGRAAGRGAHQDVAPFGEVAQAGEILVRHAFPRIAVVVADLHVEAGRAARDLLADGAQPEDAQALAGHVRRQSDGVAPDAFAAEAVQRAQAAHDGDEQAEGMVGHAVVVGAGAVGHGDAARPGGVERDVLVAGAQSADELERGHGLDFLGREADGADGQYRAETPSLRGDRLRAVVGGGRVVQVIGGGDLGLVLRRQGVEGQEGNARGGHGGSFQSNNQGRHAPGDRARACRGDCKAAAAHRPG